MNSGARWDAVVLAGGRGSRLGEATKPAVVVGGIPLLDRVLAGVRAARQVVVVGERAQLGDTRLSEGVALTREEPPFGGPAAGVAAALAALAAGGDTAPWTALLACDLPRAPEALEALLGALEGTDDPSVDGLALVDDTGRTQWLLGLYRTASLRRALDELGPPQDRSMRALLAPLRLRTVEGWEHTTGDVDTWADVAAWDAVLAQGHPTQGDTITPEEREHR
ncbi:MAG: NTP transferase domain-containing protein [Micrococcales bacterium]|nr:NTP transferase domain-containing protein [Micrococcales bacterium]